MKKSDPVFVQRFDVAVLIALAAGKLESADKASSYCSFSDASSFYLKDKSAIPILKITLEDLDREVSERPNTPRIPEGLNALTDSIEISRDEKRRAIEWAKSMSYPIPEEPMGEISALVLCVVAFLFCFIPGIFALMYVNNRSTQYAREMTALRTKWVDAGKPEPGNAGNPMDQLEAIPEKSVEERLEEISSMKNKGLISNDEYEAMRKKALGL